VSARPASKGHPAGDSRVAGRVSCGGARGWSVLVAELDLPEWAKFITLCRTADDEVVEGELSFRYWLGPPFSGDYRANYEAHAALE